MVIFFMANWINFFIVKKFGMIFLKKTNKKLIHFLSLDYNTDNQASSYNNPTTNNDESSSKR